MAIRPAFPTPGEAGLSYFRGLMSRKPTSIRLSDSEKRVLRAASRREGRAMAALIREEALAHAVTVLERELEDIQPHTRRETNADG